MNQLNSPPASVQSGQPNVSSGIMEAFQFTTDDLAANRMGTVTDKQRGQLKMARSQWERLLISALGAMFAVGAGYVAYSPDADHVRQVFVEKPFLIVPVVGVVLLFWGAIIAYTWIRTRRMSTGKLNTISGPVKLVGKPMQAVGGKVYQRIKIGRRDFYVSNVQAQTLTPGAAYMVYFVGSGQMAQIISVEADGSTVKA